MTVISFKRQPNPIDETAGQHLYAVLLGVLRSGSLAVRVDHALVLSYAAAVLMASMKNPKMVRVVAWEMHNVVANLHARGLQLSRYDVESNPCTCPHDHDWDRTTCDVLAQAAAKGDYLPGMQAVDELIENPPAGYDVLDTFVQVFAPHVTHLMGDIVTAANKVSQN